jgi:nucleoside-diphosphate-sugar epimerase
MVRKKVGITGAGGRIGGILAAALASEYDLRLFVFDAPISKDSLCQTVSIPSSVVLAGLTEGEGLEVVRGLDLSDSEAVKGKFTGLDYVIHLAANGIPLPVFFDSLSFLFLLSGNV